MKLATPIVAALLCLALSAAASAGESGLDPGFGGDGVVISDFGNVGAGAGELGLAPDGTLVAAGSHCSVPPVRGRKCDLVMTRYNAAGVETRRTPSGFALVDDFLPTAMAIDREGRILVGGYQYSGEWQPDLVRFTSEGAVDPSLSAAEIFSERFAPTQVEALAIDAAGRILLAGVGGTEPGLHVARLLPDGSFDASFGGGDGVVTSEANIAFHEVRRLVTLPDGGIVLAVAAWGNESVSSTLHALDADGNPRAGFSPETRFEREWIVSDLTVDSQGRLVAALMGQDNGLRAARFLADGSLDGSFGQGGVASAFPTEEVSSGHRVAVDPFDRPIVMGPHFEVARFTTSGDPDRSFAHGGYAKAPLGRAFTSSALALDATGRIVLAGNRRGRGSIHKFALVRFGAPSCLSTGATLVGTPGDDRLLGTPGRDVVLAGAGNDTIVSQGGNDLICAGPGSDKAIAGDGNDRVNGQAGADRLIGQRGADVLLGGPGQDLLLGGPGRNRTR